MPAAIQEAVFQCEQSRAGPFRPGLIVLGVASVQLPCTTSAPMPILSHSRWCLCYTDLHSKNGAPPHACGGSHKARVADEEST